MTKEEIRRKLVGPVFPAITSFKEAPYYEVDYDAMLNYIDFLYDKGARIFYVMAYNCRFSLLSYDEIKSINSIVTTHIKKRDEDCIVIVADPMLKSTDVSIEFTEHAEACGADIISLIFMERYHFDDQIYKHFETVSENTDIGLLLHEQQLESIHGNCLYPIELLERIVDIDNVVAIKEDSKNYNYSEQVIESIKDRVNIIISGEGKRQYVHFNPMGCHAYLVGVGSFVPQVTFDFYTAYKNNNMAKAWAIINEIERPFFKIGLKYGWHPSLKIALESMNLMSCVERPPLCELPSEQFDDVVEVLHEIKSSRYFK